MSHIWVKANKKFNEAFLKQGKYKLKKSHGNDF